MATSGEGRRDHEAVWEYEAARDHEAAADFKTARDVEVARYLVAARKVSQHEDQSLPPALPGECLSIPGPAGDLNVYATGSGPPLLLIHSINAAASAAEVRPLHEHYRSTHRVYSLELPGFGRSERRDYEYLPRTMTDAVLACARLIQRACGNSFDALAVSLSCEYLARAAMEAPGLFRSVALVSPTGFQQGAVRHRVRPEVFLGSIEFCEVRDGVARSTDSSPGPPSSAISCVAPGDPPPSMMRCGAMTY